MPRETQLKISHSPNHINNMKIVKLNEFPNPTLRIKYDHKYITKTKLPDHISVEWEIITKLLLHIQDKEGKRILLRENLNDW
ncbi:hypothetical protein J2Z23_004463 [Lederbergia galactosidilyticus]|nr:hypothetical protein [Lederbergia galactosidilytica]